MLGPVALFSQSFGAPEPDFGSAAAIQQLRFACVNAYRHHMTMLAASGDSGASGPTLTGTSFDQRVVYWPASDPLVTGVGGTELRRVRPRGVRHPRPSHR